LYSAARKEGREGGREEGREGGREGGRVQLEHACRFQGEEERMCCGVLM